MRAPYLFIDAKNPGFYVGVVVMGNVVDGEYGSVFDRVSAFRPEGWKGLLQHSKKSLINFPFCALINAILSSFL